MSIFERQDFLFPFVRFHLLFYSTVTFENMAFQLWTIFFILLSTPLSQADTSTLQARDFSRQLTLVTTTFLKEKTQSRFSGRDLFHSHAALQFEAVGDEPALRVQLAATPETLLQQGGLDIAGTGNNPLTLVSVEMATNARLADNRIPAHLARTFNDLGTVNYKNADIMDPRTGAGLVWDAWSTDPVYRSGRTPTGKKQVINDCNSMVRRLLNKMKVPPQKRIAAVFKDSEEYALRDGQFVQVDVKVGLYRSLNRDPKKGLTAFHLDAPPPSSPVEADQYQAPELQSTDLGPPDVTSSPEDNLLGHGNTQDPELTGGLGAVSSETDICPRSGKELWSRACLPSPALFEGEIFVASSRAGGALQTIRVIGTAAAEAIGIAATVAAVVVVIVDFVNHNWVGGSFGLAGLVAGIAVAGLVSGPAGWVLAGAITAFFAILPGAFVKAANPPRITDTIQILQWATFGDSSHTGNEGCQKQHPNANCTTLYGAGVLSLVFQWDNFDSIAFLIAHNDGYAMSIPDIANAFQVVDLQKPGDSAQAAAVIDCGTLQRIPSRWRLQQGSPKWCPKPTFVLRRNIITLPLLNQTADQVFNRIVPHSGGDCVLVNDAATTQILPDYNITLVGGQAAIACNLTAGFKELGTVVPINNQGLPMTIQGTETNSHRDTGRRSKKSDKHRR